MTSCGCKCVLIFYFIQGLKLISELFLNIPNSGCCDSAALSLLCSVVEYGKYNFEICFLWIYCHLNLLFTTSNLFHPWVLERKQNRDAKTVSVISFNSWDEYLQGFFFLVCISYLSPQQSIWISGATVYLL